MTDPWMSRQMAADAAWVRLEAQLSAVAEAALAEMLAKLWRMILGERPAITAAAAQPPSLDGIEQAARETWNQALNRWLRPILFAAYAEQYDAENMPVAARDEFWDATLARLTETADRVIVALREEVQGAPTESVDQLRDRIARVLSLDAATKSIRDRIEDVEDQLASTRLSRSKADELLAKRVRLQAELFRTQASRARSKAYLALAQALPEDEDQFRDLARQAARSAGDESRVDRELGLVDAELYPGDALTPEQEDHKRDQLAALEEEAAADAETWRNTAERIARTESTNVLNEATLQRGIDAEQASKEELIKVWLSSRDERVRFTHAPKTGAHGQVQPLSQPFTVGGALLQRPGDPDGPPEEVINCVVGSTQVSWPGQDVHLVTRRPHAGQFVEIRTARGHHLTVTPNHPILTTLGYLPASQVSPGQYVLATLAPPSPEVDDGPPSIEQVHGAALNSGVTSRVVGSGVNFHGDGSESEVEVVRPDRNLSGDFYPKILGNGSHATFVGCLDAEVALSGNGRGQGWPKSARVRGRDLGTSAPGLLSGGSESAPLLDGHSSEPDPVGLAGCASGDAELSQTTGDERSTDSDFAGHLSHALASGMTPCEVVEVNVASGNHVVFNLETSDGWYIGNGIAQHNCRCTISVLTREEHEEIAAVLAAATTEEAMTTTPGERPTDELPIGFRGIFAPLDRPTGDGRMLATPPGGEVKFRQQPWPMLWQPAMADGHDGAVVVGKTAKFWVEDGMVWGQGPFDLESENGREAARLLAGKFINGLSIDPDDVIVEWDEAAEVAVYTDWRIMGGTFLPYPAFDEARLEPVYANDLDLTLVASLLASASEPFGWEGEKLYRAEWFEDPKLTEWTPLTITPEGRVFGHVADRSQCHIGIGDKCTLAPRSTNGYQYFHRGAVLTDAGEIPIGKLTVGIGHANGRYGYSATAAHYDDAKAAVAVVRCYDDEIGPAVAGQLIHGVAGEKVAQLRMSPLSGDWRPIGGQLELVAALGVNVPGFPGQTRETVVMAGGQVLSVVAAGMRPKPTLEEQVAGEVRAAFRREDRARELAARVGLDPRSRATALAARIATNQEA